MVCPMRGLLVVASALVAALTALATALSRWRAGGRGSEDGGDGASPRVWGPAEAKTPTDYARWAVATLWDAASGKYLARTAAAAWRASRSPSPPGRGAVKKRA